MRKIIQIWAIAMLSILTVFSSCSKDDATEIPEPTPTPTPTPTPEPEPEPETKTARYTVMFYGCGGGNLDVALDYNLGQATSAPQDSVNFVALIKKSAEFQKDPEQEGVRQIEVTKKNGKANIDNKKVYEASYRMDNPANLTAFINDTKKNFPAKQYILVLWNHGSEFGFGEKPVQASYLTDSRAVLYDDNISKDSLALSTYELEKGIKDSGTKLDLVYFDCCLMGMAETYYQLKDCARYGMGAFHLTPGLGGDYVTLMENLQNKPTLEEAIKDYVPKCVDNWHQNSSPSDSIDLECYDLSYMTELKEKVAPVALYLKRLVTDQQEEAQEVLDQSNYYLANNFADVKGISIRNFTTSTDLYSTVNRLALIQEDNTLAGYADGIKTTLDKMTIAEKCYVEDEDITRISMGITWPTFAFWHGYNEQGIFYGSKAYNFYPTGIDNSAFLQDSGWLTFLSEFSNKFSYNY